MTAQPGEHLHGGTGHSRFWKALVSIIQAPYRTSAWLLNRLRLANPQWFWLLNAAAFLVLIAWMVLDPRFELVGNQLQLASGLNADILPRDGSQSKLPILLLGGLIGLVVSTFLLMLVTLVGGSHKHRSLRAWFVFVALFSLWIATARSWQDVTWWGKQWRLRSQVGEFETVAKELRAHWPRHDGELASSDPYMAYPVGSPATLIMLTLPRTTRAGTSFSVVERGKSGALRFQLTGRERGDWLEWHPAGEKPASFVGGLLDPHELEEYWDLGDGWFLVRYRD